MQRRSFISRRHNGPLRSDCSGFSLVELMIVILIIAILVGIAVPVFMSMQRRHRDTRRQADMRILHDVLVRYGFDTEGYPTSDGQGSGGWDTPGDGDFIAMLATRGYVKRDALDPSVNNGSGNYRYYRYAAGSYGADPAKGPYFVLGVVDMETTARPHPQSPGWRTPGRNWQMEMDWVVGGYLSN